MGIPFIKMALFGLLPSRVKIAYYRMQGARIGKRVRIGLFSVLSATEIEIGDDCSIGAISFISVKKLRLGNRVRIGSMVMIETGDVAIGHDSVVMEQTVVGGMLTPRSSFHVGNRVKIFPYCFINPTEPIIIEDDVGVGGSTYLFTHGSWQSVLDGFPIGFGPIHIRKGVWLPWRVFILPNVEIGEYATIGAGAVINRTIAPRTLAAGMPAKAISEDGKHLRPLNDEQRWEKVISIFRELAEFLTWQGKTARLEGAGGAYTLHVQGGTGVTTTRIALLQGAGSVPADSDVVVCMGPLASETTDRLDVAGKAWFDIETRAMSLTLQPAVDDIRNFFSRFGVRFSVVSDPVFAPTEAL